MQIDYEYLGLSIVLILIGTYLIKNNNFWKLDKNDLKMISKIQLFGSGIASLLIVIIVLVYLLLNK